MFYSESTVVSNAKSIDLFKKFFTKDLKGKYISSIFLLVKQLNTGLLLFFMSFLLLQILRNL